MKLTIEIDASDNKSVESALQHCLFLAKQDLIQNGDHTFGEDGYTCKTEIKRDDPTV